MGRHLHTPVVDNSRYLAVDTNSAVVGFAVAALAVEQVAQHSGLVMLIEVLGVGMAQSYMVALH